MKHEHVRRKALKAIACAVLFLAVVVGGFYCVETFFLKDDANGDDAFSYSDYDGEQVYYNGAYYIPKKSLDTLLVLGIDASEDRPDSLQSDFIALIVLDRDKKCFEVLHINRDTMADFPRISDAGDSLGTMYGQLSLAHNYGGDERARCRNTVATVENILYGIDIAHHLSMTMDAVPVLNDSVGGVTVSLLDDFTHVNPAYTKDAVVTLMGEDALAYIRERGALEDSSNLSRMERQKQYLRALFDKVRSVEADDAFDSFLGLGEKISTDCTTDQLQKLLERMKGCTFNGLTSLAGEAVMGEQYMEYHLDEPAVRETVIRLFYDPLEK